MRNKRIAGNDRKINQKNKSLLIDKIFAYNPVLLEGIEVYKDANRNFTLLIVLGVLLIDFPLISIPCCVLSMFFVVQMLQFSRYKSINNIVKELAKDLSYKGIYDKEKVEDMLEDFKVKYGEDITEYSDLVSMIDKYESLVIKIEYALRNVSMHQKRKVDNKDIRVNEKGMSFLKNEDNENYEKLKRSQYMSGESNNYYRNFNEKLSILYKNEDGEIKKVNKAIEFFDEENNESYKNENAVVLRNTNKENKNLTIYLYKKSSALQKNVL